MKLKCVICGKDHKARVDKFPIIFHGYAEVLEGEGKEAKLVVKEIEIGHGCKKCNVRRATRAFIKEHKIKQKVGQTLRDAVRAGFKKINCGHKIKGV